MNFGLVFFKLLPLILYIIFDYWKGFKAGIIAAIVASAVSCGFDFMTNGTVEPFTLGESSLIILLGFVSLKMNNDRFFKFQPTVLAFIFASVFLFFEAKNQSFLVEYIPELEKLFVSSDPVSSLSAQARPGKKADVQAPEIKEFLASLHTDRVKHLFTLFSRLLILVFVGHGLIMAYAALHWSTAKWFAWRFAIYPGMLVAMMVCMMVA